MPNKILISASQNWLGGRTQRVVVTACYSGWRVLTSDVHKGSMVLLSFVINVNNSSDIVVNVTSEFAGDVTIEFRAAEERLSPS